MEIHAAHMKYCNSLHALSVGTINNPQYSPKATVTHNNIRNRSSHGLTSTFHTQQLHQIVCGTVQLMILTHYENVSYPH